MQQNYVHSIIKFAKGKEVATGKRMAIIFRNGRELNVPVDTGFEVTSTAAPDRSPPTYRFGHLEGLEEGELYSRMELVSIGAHQMDRRGVSGNTAAGCNAIIVSKGHPASLMGTDDHFHYLTYSATGNQGAAALDRSMQDRKPIRVFRSSKGSKGHFKEQAQVCVRAPYLQSSALKFAPEVAQIKYRYDGLYQVTGKVEDSIGGSMKAVARFRLLRAEPRPARDSIHSKLDVYNKNHPSLKIEIISDEDCKKPASSIVDGVEEFDLQAYDALINLFPP
jgi:hypothetical protein